MCVLVIAPSIALSQSITGSVTDSSTGNPLDDVNIDILDSPAGTFSRQDGYFAIHGLHPGQYVLRASCMGYALHEETFVVSGREPVHTDIMLKPAVLYLNKGFVVTAQRYETDRFGVPAAVSILEQEQLQRDPPRSTPEALIGVTGIWMQKTNHGGGSPFIRGLTGNQTLLMIDGIRLNNATYRYGPNQYLNTVNPSSIERIEVIRGSGSVLYGSDALGGVVNIITERPRFTDHGVRLSGKASFKYMSADMEKSTRGGIEISTPHVSCLCNVGLHDFGDIEAGVDLGTEIPSGYEEISGDAKGVFRLGSSNLLTLAYQHVKQKDVPRYDQVAQRGYATYSFDPQIRQSGYARLQRFFGDEWLRSVQLTGSLHRSIEERITQKGGDTVIVNERDEVDTRGLTLELRADPGKLWEIIAGIEYYYDCVHSWKKELDTSTQTETGERGLYADGATSSSIALFVSNGFYFDRLSLTAGGRVSAFTVSTVDEEFGDLDITPRALVGDLSALYALHPEHHVSLGVNTGFRAPNINDVSSFGSFDFGIEVPSSDLSPERSLTVEAGLKSRMHILSASVALYKTFLFDLIDRVESTYRGEEMYKGEKVYKKENVDNAYVQGAEAEVEVPVFAGITAFGNIVYTYGQNSSRDEPLRRIPPLNGRIGIRYRRIDGWWGEFEWLGATAQDRLAPGDIADHRIPPGGTPGWEVVNMQAGISLRRFTLSAGLQNLFDEAYRIHGSGIDGYGRSFWIACGIH
jgi:outer membrane cobalamin receptor